MRTGKRLAHLSQLLSTVIMTRFTRMPMTSKLACLLLVLGIGTAGYFLYQQSAARRASSMDPLVDQWFAEWRRLEAAVEPYRLRILAKESKGSKLNKEEDVFWNLYYFWQAALINNGDVFGYVAFIIEQKAAFEAVDAKGCLAALEKLMPFYTEQQKLATKEEKNAYWHRTKEARQSAEALAEETNVFGALLLEYAEKNAGKIGND